MNTRIGRDRAAGRPFFGYVLFFMMTVPIFAGLISGCSSWRDLSGPPMVIDASQRNQEYARQPGYTGGNQGYNSQQGYQNRGLSNPSLSGQPGTPTANSYGGPNPQNPQAYSGGSMMSYPSSRQPMQQQGNMPSGYSASTQNGYDARGGYAGAGMTGSNYNNGYSQNQTQPPMRVESVQPIREPYSGRADLASNSRSGISNPSTQSPSNYTDGRQVNTVDSPRGPVPSVSKVRVSESNSDMSGAASMRQGQAVAGQAAAYSLPSQGGNRSSGMTAGSPPMQASQAIPLSGDTGFTPPDSNRLGQTQPAVKIDNISEPQGSVQASPVVVPTSSLSSSSSTPSLSSSPSTSPLSSSPSPIPVRLNDILLMLEQYIERDPDNVDAQLALRFLYQAYGLNDKATGPIRQVPMDRQAEALRLARTLLLAQEATNRVHQNDPETAQQAMEALETLSDQVCANADVEVKNLRICKDAARGFGQYTELETSKLQSGSPQTIWVYFELEHFQVRQDEQGKYSSKISAEIALYDEQFRMVQQMLKAEVPDESYNRRHDFYLHAGPLKLPALSPGKYQLVVSVEDQIAGKAARPARFEFEVKPNNQNPK